MSKWEGKDKYYSGLRIYYIYIKKITNFREHSVRIVFFQKHDHWCFKPDNNNVIFIKNSNHSISAINNTSKSNIISHQYIIRSTLPIFPLAITSNKYSIGFLLRNTEILY